MKRLEDDDVKIEVIRYDSQGLSKRKISEILGIPKSTIGDFLKQKTHKDFWENYKPIAAGTIQEPEESRKNLEGKRFVFTSAQNNTFVHETFLKSLELYADINEAEIIVGTFLYNKSGFQNGKAQETWFDPKIQKYIQNHSAFVANDLIWCGELNILPTAVNPLSGFESYTKDSSGIIPHVKIQLQSVPRMNYVDSPRFMYTTGTVTQRNYIDMKSGQKASFHHVFGALVVELDESGDWFARQIICDNEGGFYDLDRYYNGETGIVKHDNALAVNWGDIHVEKMDNDVCNGAFYNENSITDVLKPEFHFIHDVIDFSSRNHHVISDPHFIFKQVIDGNTVENEMNEVSNFIESIASDNTHIVIVQSNHDDAILKWLKTADYKQDPFNALTFLELQYQVYNSINSGEYFSPLKYHFNKLNPEHDHDKSPVTFLKEDDSFMIYDDINGIECGLHGHRGINGSRGSYKSMSKLGTRCNIGHSHSAGIFDGVYVAGACMTTKNSGYAHGPTTWSTSHIITYKNGKRAIITQRGSKWRS